MDFVKENADEIVFDFELSELGEIVDSMFGSCCSVRFLDKSLNPFVHNVVDRLEFGLAVGAHRGVAVIPLDRVSHLSCRRTLVTKVLRQRTHDSLASGVAQSILVD